MTVLGLERLRVGYDEGNRTALWLLLGLFAFVVAARHVAPLIYVGRLDDVILAPADLLAAMPVLLAAVALLVAPGRRLLVAGAMMLAAAAVLTGLGRLSPILGDAALALGIPATLLFVAGPLLFGHGLGGVRSRLGVALVGVGLLLSVAAAGYAFSMVLPLLESADAFDAALLGGSVVGQFTYLGWAYVLAAAIERGTRLIAVGAGLMILVPLASIALGEFARLQPPGFVLPEAWVAFLVFSFGAWAALIFGVIREVDDRGMVAGR